MAHRLGLLGLFAAVLALLGMLESKESRPSAGRFPGWDGSAELARELARARLTRASWILSAYVAVPQGRMHDSAEMIGSPRLAGGEFGATLELRTLLSGRSRDGPVPLGVPDLTYWLDRDGRLERYLSFGPGAGDRERGLSQIAVAAARLATGDVPGALRAYDEAAVLVPQLEDWLAIRAAEAAASKGDTAEVRRRLAGVDRGLSEDWGWQIRSLAYRIAGQLPQSLAIAEAAARSLAETDQRAEAWVVVGHLRAMKGDRRGARRAFLHAIDLAPGGSAAVDGARALGAFPGASPREQLKAGRVYLRHGNLQRGVAGLRAFLDAGAGTYHERTEVRLELGSALFRLGEHAQAEELLLEVAASARSERIRAEALLQVARLQTLQGRPDSSEAMLLRIARHHAHTPAGAEALYLLGDRAHDQNRIEAARHYYERAAAARPDLEHAGFALMRLGGLSFAAGDVTGAARIFEDYRQHHPKGRRHQQATFWAGRAYLQLGRTDLGHERLRQARQADPFSFYGIRAAELLGSDFWDLPIEPSPPPNPKLESAMQTALTRIDLLRELGWDAAANFELERLRRHYGSRDGGLYALAEAYNARGLTFTGIRLGWEIFRREGFWNPRLLRILYPFPYEELIRAEAQRLGIDPYLVAGLIRQESMFQPAIRSSAGAIGLMQIMPATGKALASAAGVDSFDLEMLELPELNVQLGTSYLAELLGAYGQRLAPALAAYNAGPGRVARWRQLPEWVDDELFAERIPFLETREYVKTVRQNASIYAALYPLGAASRPGPP